MEWPELGDSNWSSHRVAVLRHHAATRREWTPRARRDVQRQAAVLVGFFLDRVCTSVRKTETHTSER